MLEVFSKNKDKIAPAAIILTALFSGVVVEEVKDTLGTTVLYHPLTVWFVLFCIVFVQTKSFVISLACVVGYQVIKMVWTLPGFRACARYSIPLLPVKIYRMTIFISWTRRSPQKLLLSEKSDRTLDDNHQRPKNDPVKAYGHVTKGIVLCETC